MCSPIQVVAHSPDLHFVDSSIGVACTLLLKGEHRPERKRDDRSDRT